VTGHERPQVFLSVARQTCGVCQSPLVCGSIQHLSDRSTPLTLMTDRIRPRAGLWELFVVYFWIGIQSFGGGSATLYLIHQTSITRGWLDEVEFTRAWALIQIAPGINLIKITALIGYQLRGWPGVAAAVAGLVLPSGCVTALMTAGFSAVRDEPAVQAAMRGVLPATIGVSVAIAAQMGLPVLRLARRESGRRLGAHVLVLVGAALLLAAAGLSPALVLLAAGAVTAALLAVLPSALRRQR
jgi:chromate transporter